MPQPQEQTTPRQSHRIATIPGAGAAGRLVARVGERLDGVDVAALETQYGSVDAVVDRMLAAFPNVNMLDAIVGPFRDTANMRAFLGLTRQGIDERVRAGSLLCVRTADGHRLFPDFQFDAHRQGLPRLREILDAFHADRRNAWDTALWLAQPDPDLHGVTPATALHGADADAVVQLARQAGSALAA